MSVTARPIRPARAARRSVRYRSRFWLGGRAFPTLSPACRRRLSGSSRSAFVRDPVIAHGPRAIAMLRCSVCGLRRPPQHVAEVVVDGVQVLRGGVDRAEFYHEAIADDAVAERLLGLIRSVPGEVHCLA